MNDLDRMEKVGADGRSEADRDDKQGPLSAEGSLRQYHSDGPVRLLAPSAYRLIGQVLQALGIVSLLQGSLDITLGLEQAMTYYFKLRDLLLSPVELAGLKVPTRYADLWIIASVFASAVSRPGRKDDIQVAMNFFGSLALFWPFILINQLTAKAVVLMADYLQPTIDHLAVGWILVVLFLAIYTGFLLLWASAFCLLGAFASFYWPIVLVVPFVHRFIVRLCVLLGKRKISPWITRLLLGVYGPGILLARGVAAIGIGQCRGMNEIMQTQRDYWSELTLTRIKGYYWLLGHYLFGSLFVLLILKLFVDSFKIF